MRTITGREARSTLRRCIVFNDLSWRQYELVLRAFERQRFRHSYSHRTLEVMSPLFFQEHNASRLGWFVESLLTQLRIHHLCAGAMTLKRKDAHRGLEPDKCYYIDNYRKVLGKEVIDLDKDPPPDFALEMEYTRTVVRRLPIYAKLGIPEVWRYNGETLQVLELNEGKCVASPKSRTFPFLDVDELRALLLRLAKTDDLTWKLEVQNWIKKRTRSPKGR